ncbi:anticodon-binding protein [Lasiosphaeris hirsuta]|uniref:U3 small nucleolar ribonucleoprotein protein IMP4 n=1 Tax=Lasiosphaeris hirsuta TaxID=260670 RepID=A0AA40ARQ7_9PEZI|nr:anticodon-binding protein [Lasiosphaeris hirsuta]
MIRKQARQRRDYLYRKATLLRDAEVSEKRAALRASLASGRALDPEIANDKELRKDYDYDVGRDVNPDENLDVDDEYSELSGVVDPRILVTTSRDPSSRLMSFSKEFRLILPTGIRLNRGNLVLPELVRSAQSERLSDVILLHEHRGTPTAITISHFPHGPTLMCSLHNVVLRADIPRSVKGTVSESYPHLIFENFTTPLGKRLEKILKHLWPPRDTTALKNVGNRVITFVNQDDCIEFRHHVYVRTGYDSVELSEVGPRFTMRPFSLTMGTLDQKEADVEWSLHQYTRTSRKKNYF